MSTDRWLSVGRSMEADSRRAGEDAARGAITGDDPGLLIVFCSANHDPVQLLAGISGVGGGVPLIGCSTRVVITPDGPSTTSVTVTAVGGPGVSVAAAPARRASSRAREAGAAGAGRPDPAGGRPHPGLPPFT